MLMADLKGVHYDPTSVQKALRGTAEKLSQNAEQIAQFSDWLQDEIS